MMNSSGKLTLIRALALAVTLGLAIQALAGVVEPGPWQGEITVALLSVVVPVMIVRALGSTPILRGRLVLNVVLPWLVGLLSLATYVLLRYGGSDHDTPERDGGFLQSVTALFDPVTARATHIAETMQPLADEIQTQSAPIASSAAFVVTAALGIGLLYIIFDMIIVGLGATWAVVVPVAALWTAPLLLLVDIPWPVLLGTMAAILVVVTTGQAPPALAYRRIGAVAVSGVVILAVTFAGTTIVLQDREPVPLGLFKTPGAASSGPIQLGDSVSVGSSLSPQSTQVAYRYVDEILDPPEMTGLGVNLTNWNEVLADARRAPMRISTAASFDGQTWTAGRSGDNSQPVDNQQLLLNLNAADPGMTGGIVRQIELLNLSGSLIPMMLAPARVTGIQASYDFSHDELSRRIDATSYQLAAYPPSYSADDLRASSRQMSDVPLSPQFTELPTTAHIDEIATLAEEITADATSPYDQLVALQRFFRDPGEFTYDTNVAETINNDPVWTFLQTRHGYCVQFATGMAVMARSLGIPTRFAQGFLPGTRLASGEVEVTGTRAHAWPEFFFPGQGWVRFEPTPASQSSQAPSWTREPASPAEPTDPTPPRPTPTPTPPQPTPDPPATPPTTPSTPDAQSSHWVRSTPAQWGFTSLAVLLAGAALWLVWLRRRSHRARPVEGQWSAVLRQAGQAGVSLTSSMTPRRAAQAIAGLLTDAAAQDGRAQHRSPTLAQSLESLDELVTAVELGRYDEPGGERGGARGDSADAGLSAGLSAGSGHTATGRDDGLKASGSASDAAQRLEQETALIITAIKNVTRAK